MMMMKRSPPSVRCMPGLLGRCCSRRPGQLRPPRWRGARGGKRNDEEPSSVVVVEVEVLFVTLQLGISSRHLKMLEKKLSALFRASSTTCSKPAASQNAVERRKKQRERDRGEKAEQAAWSNREKGSTERKKEKKMTLTTTFRTAVPHASELAPHFLTLLSSISGC